MFEYIVERNKFVTSFWKLCFKFNKCNFNNSDFILITRTDGNGRYFKLKITENKISYYVRKTTFEFNHNILFNEQNNYCQIIWKSFSECELIINNESWNLGKVYCSDTTIIKSTIELFDYNIKYLNFNSYIPRVYSDCFGNIHTHRMFGKWCYDIGANYYNYGHPKISLENLLNTLINDYNICPNKKIFLFFKAYISNEHALDTYNIVLTKLDKSSIPLSYITFCTMPHSIEQCSIWNSLISKHNYIDFNKDFINLENIENYFEDEAHTNELGGKILFERIKIDAPELCTRYNIKY